MRISDWSSDVCSSDLADHDAPIPRPRPPDCENGRVVEFTLVTVERTTGLSRTADGRVVPSAVERGRGALTRITFSDRLLGWLAPIGLMLLALGLRVYHLGSPNRFAFDETYYAKDAWSLTNHRYQS